MLPVLGAHATSQPGAPQLSRSAGSLMWSQRSNICSSSATVACAAANVAAANVAPAVCFTEFLGAVPLEQRKEVKGEGPERGHVTLTSAARTRSSRRPNSIVLHLSVVGFFVVGETFIFSSFLVYCKEREK